MTKEPSTHQNSIVSFWSKPIRDRLSQSSLSPGQAAKRDLARYHALLDTLPGAAIDELDRDMDASLPDVIRRYACLTQEGI
jgi:hypothetical protein